MNFYETLKNEISMENICRDMTYLVEEVGERLSGTDKMRKATEYIRSRLEENGVCARIDHFPMYQSYPGEAYLKVVSPEEREIKARPVCHIDSTPEGGLEGELIYLESGAYEDYEGKDVKDKIVLTNMDWSPGRPEKARIAWEMGAKALIIMNWGEAGSDLIQMGAVKSQWGNPTPETIKDVVRLAVISVSRKDGEYLASLCGRQEGGVSVYLEASATREWITADQPIGFLKGKNAADKYVLIGSHVDAWGKSAICNASGNALNLEIARVFAKHRDELDGRLVFTFWDGHEIAEGGGSTWYADNYWQDMTENCIGYVNIDNLAISGTTIPGVEGQPELKNLLMEAIRAVFGEEGLWHQAYKGGGDSSFFGVGVPYTSFATEYTEEKLKELNYAFYSPWLHTDDDTVDKIDMNLMRKHAEYFIYVIEKLLNYPVFPYDLEALADDVENQWRQIMDASGRAKDMLAAVSPKIEEYAASLKEFYGLRNGVCGHEKARGTETKDDGTCGSEEGTGGSKRGGLSDRQKEIYDKAAVICERHTAMFRCYSGRYGQDACCALATENPIPALKKALDKYNAAEQGSEEYYLWETMTLRTRNMVFDALDVPIKAMELAKAALYD